MRLGADHLSWMYDKCSEYPDLKNVMIEEVETHNRGYFSIRFTWDRPEDMFYTETWLVHRFFGKDRAKIDSFEDTIY